MLTVALVATLSAAALWQQWRALAVESAERQRVQGSWILAGALDWGSATTGTDGTGRIVLSGPTTGSSTGSSGSPRRRSAPPWR